MYENANLFKEKWCIFLKLFFVSPTFIIFCKDKYTGGFLETNQFSLALTQKYISDATTTYVICINDIIKECCFPLGYKYVT